MRVALRMLLTMVLGCIIYAGISASVTSAQSVQVRPSPLILSASIDTVITRKGAAAWGSSGAPGIFSRSPVQGSTQSHWDPPGDWPSPVNDQAKQMFVLVDVLEYRPRTGGGQPESDYRWDIEGWYGGDYNRVWFKSEGQQDTAFKADYDVDSQLLYGRLIAPYYDFQVGGRVETQSFRNRNVTRGLAAIGIEGLVPYSYEIEATAFIDQNGAVSARASGTKDLLLTQRLIFQLRFETNLALQRVEEFTTGSGLNNLEFGARLRYEIRREFAPYVGVSLDRSFGETATLVRQEGGNPNQVRFGVGVRMWF